MLLGIGYMSIYIKKKKNDILWLCVCYRNNITELKLNEKFCSGYSMIFEIISSFYMLSITSISVCI